MLKFGIVSEVKPGFVRVSFEEDELVSNWLPVIVDKSLTDKTSYPLEPNEHVACMMDEHMEYGVVIGAIYSEADAPDGSEAPGKFRMRFADDTLIEYDRNTHRLTAKVYGNIDVEAFEGNIKAKAVDIEATAVGTAKVIAPIITLEGNVVVTGTLTAAGVTSSAGIATTGGGSITSDGNMVITGNIAATGDVKAGSVSLKTHVHTGVQSGPGVTGLPQ